MAKTVEEWKDIEGYEGFYQVSDWGRVRSLDRYELFLNNKTNKKSVRKRKGRIIKIDYNCKGKYGRVPLNKNNIEIKHRVHRLVAIAFIPNPENKPQVGHWDCDTTNNKIENLYWCTQPENMENPITKQRQSDSKKGKKRSEESIKKQAYARMKTVYQYTLNGELVTIYPSVMEAERNGFCHAHIIHCCKGERKTYKGYLWSYTPLQ